MYEERSMHIKKDFPVHQVKLNLKYLKKERKRFENKKYDIQYVRKKVGYVQYTLQYLL